MAVTSTSELPERKGGWDKLWRRTYTRVWRVECDDTNDGPYTIRLGAGLPSIGAYYHVNATELDAGAFLESFSYDQEHGFASAHGSQSVWKVTANYGPYDAGTFGNNPTSWPVRVAFTAQKYERPILADQAGVPVLNSASCPFDEPVTIDDSRSIVTVKRHESVASFDYTLAELYRDKVNNAAWNGFPTKSVKCTSITTSDQQYDSNSQTWLFEVTYIFEVNRDLWQKKILDQGYQKLVSGKPTPITNSGKIINEPVPLDGSGAPLTLPITGMNPAVFLTFDVYPSADFSVFNIDLSTALGR